MVMRNPARIRIVLLALMLAVSHITLMSHVTAHFQPNLEQCELCVGQAQLFTALPSADLAVAVENSAAVSPLLTARYLIATPRYRACQQRAPPILSA